MKYIDPDRKKYTTYITIMDLQDSFLFLTIAALFTYLLLCTPISTIGHDTLYAMYA